ncbi:MAG: cytochrome c, partial [Proteobacteria bacterium]|nr:cytochrome c [Pseudomonadota bacterium]
VGETELNEEPEAGAPTRPGYAGRDWLKAFIEDPGKHYNMDNNFMPAFKEQLTEKEINLLVRWMIKDYVPTKLAEPAQQKEK